SGVSPSSWLLIITILLSLLLAFGKRRFELESHNEKSNFRIVLTKYKQRYLDVALTIFAIVSIATYSLYSFDRGPGEFLITIPFVGFGVIRYIYLVRTKISGDPTESLFNDKWLFICVLSWLIITAVIITF
ncbi:MAG: decaprenyl-phosphate phosphoribosyltransferase, partial [Thermodesulfobacteriota bacterium]